MADRITEADKHALYQHAHHDLWWAKSQQWSVANWTLLLTAGLVGVARTTGMVASITPQDTWPFIALVALVTSSAGWYLARLHSEIVHNREVYRALEAKTGIAALRKEIPQTAGEESDRKRGLEYLYAMGAAIATAAGLGFHLLGVEVSAAIAGALAVALVHLFFLSRAA